MLLREWARAARARLIDDARQSWRFASVRIASAGALLIGAWNELPAEAREQLPAPVAHLVPTLILLAVIAGRLVKQDAGDGR